MKIGDKISVLDEDISGVIIDIKGDQVTIESDDGFEMDYPKKELVKQSGAFSSHKMFTKDISEIISEKETKRNQKSPKVKPKERTAPTMVIDLHIHQLVSNQKGLDNYDILTIQLDTAKRQLDSAIQKRMQKIVFIHGVGEGVLRLELEYLFKRYDNLKYYDADYQKYGRGATEVYIFQNNTT